MGAKRETGKGSVEWSRAVPRRYCGKLHVKIVSLTKMFFFSHRTERSRYGIQPQALWDTRFMQPGRMLLLCCGLLKCVQCLPNGKK